MTDKNRIDFGMSVLEIMMAMAEGNPGAITVLMEVFDKNANVDPDSFLGPFTSITQLDSLGLYGSDIWVLYKDICGNSAVHLMAILRANQLGILSAHDILSAVQGHISECSIDVEDIYNQVKERLPNFNSNN